MNTVQRSYDAVIFDLDGTLLDSLQDIAEAANSVLEDLNETTHAIAEYRYLVGDGVGILFQRAMSRCREDEALRADCIRRFEEAYASRWNNHSKPYNGILEVLDFVKASPLKLGILSNKPDSFTKQCASYFFPSISFDSVMGHSDQFPRKPDPASALFMAHAMGVSSDRVAYVGDTNTDMKTAVNAGFRAIGVTWGFRPETELREHGATIVVHTPSDLKAVLML